MTTRTIPELDDIFDALLAESETNPTMSAGEIALRVLRGNAWDAQGLGYATSAVRAIRKGDVESAIRWCVQYVAVCHRASR